MTPQEQRIINALIGPRPKMPASRLGADRSFAPGPGVRVAQNAPSAFGDKITPAGVGDQSAINQAAAAYRALMEGFDRYKSQIPEDGNISLLPGEQRDRIAAERVALQMQMKELLNLGVLNGPDLELLDRMMIDPLSVKNKALDFIGLADTETRARSNADHVAKIFEGMAAPKLEMMGLNPSDVYQPQQMSDEEFLKSLGIE